MLYVSLGTRLTRAMYIMYACAYNIILYDAHMHASLLVGRPARRETWGGIFECSSYAAVLSSLAKDNTETGSSEDKEEVKPADS